MGDDQRRGIARDRRERGQRHLRAVGARHAQLRECVGIGLPVAVGLEYHAILVGLTEDRRDLALAEGVVQRIDDRLHRHAEPGRRFAIDGEQGAEAVVLLIGRDVHQTGHGGELRHQARAPAGQFGGIGVDHRVLIARAADASADLDVLHGLQVDAQAGDVAQLRLEPRDDHVDAVARGRAASARWIFRRCWASRSSFPRRRTTRRPCTAGSFKIRSAASACSAARRGIETLCDASVTATTSPVSCCGRKPLGTTT